MIGACPGPDRLQAFPVSRARDTLDVALRYSPLPPVATLVSGAGGGRLAKE